MSKTASRPEDQPNQRRTARNVSRASSSPGSTSMSTPVALLDVGEHLVGVDGVAHRRGGEAAISSQPLSSATTSDEATNWVRASTPASLTAPDASRCSASRSGSLWEYAGIGAAPPLASTTSRCPVLEPMSSTPNLMTSTLVGDVGCARVPETDLVIPRAYVEFVDPDDEAQVFKCDLTWLTSQYMCIFGQGCHGIYKERPDDGCCTLGAHFSDKDDEKRTRKFVEAAHPGELAVPRGGHRAKNAWIETDDEGDRKTAVHEAPASS